MKGSTKNGKKSFKGGYKTRYKYNGKRKDETNDKKTKFKKLKGAISEAVVKVIRQDSKAEPNEYIVSLVNAAKAKTKQQPQAQVSSIQPIHRKQPPVSFVTRYSREQETNPPFQPVS